MSRRCCCPCPDAVTDNFNRSDSTDLGSKWVECSGDWSIKSNRLSVTSPTAAAILPAFPRVLGLASVELHELSPNRVYRLYAGYGTALDQCDGTSAWVCAEYVIDGTGSGARLNLITNVGGSEVILDFEDVGVSTPETLTLCAGNGRIEASVINSTQEIADCSPPGGSHWALGTGSNAGEHLFDNFSVVDHYSFNINCPQCGCGCEGYCLKETLTYTFVNNFGCVLLDGVTGTVTWRALCEWESPEITDVCFEPVNDTLQVVFRGVGGPILEYASPLDPSWQVDLIRFVDQSIWGSSGPLPGSTCDPLFLKFGPFVIPGDEISGDRCCEDSVHEFFIIITD